MTQDRFLEKLPSSIVHPVFGYGELKTLLYCNNLKGAWYYHEKHGVTAESFGEDWEVVYKKIFKYLSERGYVNKKGQHPSTGLNQA